MAAIAGIISKNGNKFRQCTVHVEKMIESMRHRGPDNVTIRTLPDCTGAFGAAEVNLLPERTRCVSATTSPYIIFDGELFNERAEGQTDLELFEEYYEKYGNGCFSYLDGSYCCAILDGDEAIIARDPIGARPIFYGIENGLFCFSTAGTGSS